jgi:signal peptidase II
MRRAVFVMIFLLTAGFDQGTKEWALSLPVAGHGTSALSSAPCEVPADLVAHTCHGVPQTVIAGYWDWELAMNTGAAFSSLDGGGARIFLAILAALAVCGIGVYAYRLRPDQRLERIALGMIAGGALGNLIDRLRHGGVTDFIRWRVGEHRWPIFNVADAALLAGVALLLIASALAHRRRTATA